MSIVYTGGTFDLFHPGHVAFLEICANVAGYPDGEVIVALNRDEFVTRFKNQPPVMTYAERRAVLLACRHVTDVIENVGDEDSKVTIELVRPRFVVIGSDWASRDYHTQMGFSREWLADHGITLLYVDRGVVPNSSTDVRQRMYVHGTSS